MKRLKLRVLRGKQIFAIFAGQAILSACSSFAFADAVDERVNQLISQMTQEEKISLLHGYNGFFTGEIPRLKIPKTKMSDGPVGTRNDGASTAYPAGALLASTWDPAIARREGEALGRDCRARGDHFLLGPGVNIYRQPQNGRNFEYLGEDPFLAGQIDASYIQGVQSQGVAGCVKHYACNNQEHNRENVNTHVDERTLHEIYLPAFEAAVKQGHVCSIMASYNRVNGDYASANRYLLTDVLRKKWGFDGVAMSDWGAVHDTLGPMTAGLDLEMPDPRYFNPQTIIPLLDKGVIRQEDIDDKVRHLLHVEVEMGWLDRPQIDPSFSRDDEANDATALAVAREGIVLLKNKGGLLPLDRGKIHKIVVLGPGGDAYIAGGGSSYTKPNRPVTIFAGLSAIAGNVQVISIPFIDQSQSRIRQLAKASVFEPVNGKPGLTATFFNNPTLKGDPALTRVDSAIDYNWRTKLPMPEITGHAFSGRWKATIKPSVPGDYIFMSRSDDGSRVFLDGKQIVDNWRDQTAHTASATVRLEAGRAYQLTVEYYNATADASMQFAWFLKQPLLTDEQRSTLAAADAAVVCVKTIETEGADRLYDLQADQPELIRETASLNSHTVVVLESGGNVAMKDWIDNVPVLVDAWYPGQAGGKAIAEVLFGETNPSGHLPDTFENDWPDSPAFGNYPGDADVTYKEGIYVGYRWYDKKRIEPRFPFGYGLSYTSFELKNLQVKPLKTEDSFTATLEVTNTGARLGATVVQVYVRPPANEKVDRPDQELKGFVRVELGPGETKTAAIPMDSRSFAHWDLETHSWQVVPGSYEIVVGQSSRDAIIRTTVQVK